MPASSAESKCSLGTITALGYAVLLMLALPLYPGSGRLAAADLLVPLMLLQCWKQRGTVLKFCRTEGRELTIAAFLAVAAVAAQFIFTGSAALYDLAVLGYMLLIFVFYLVTPLPAALSCAVGAAILTIIFTGWIAARLGIIGGLDFIDPNMVPGESGGVLARRYQFLFSNPNMLGSAFALPVAMMLPWLKRRFAGIRGWLPALALCAACFVACLPLLDTVSKHLVLTLALLAPLCAEFPAFAPLKPRLLSAFLLAAAVTGALITVWFCTAPAVSNPPWVDFSRRGNYTTHQEIYLSIITKDGIRGALVGYSPAYLKDAYPKHADREKIAEILTPYGAGNLADTFASFMDPHNEYLNFASHFGIPALIFLLAFLLRTAWKHRTDDTIFFVAALLATFFWEDMASKRWIWATLAALIASRRQIG
ncbi:MAG: hypothetical protein J6S21_02880 [Victivallales bacterium]|nr:hypothetical protein [Victivallales bacterium]